jgi:hypothetical protein
MFLVTLRQSGKVSSAAFESIRVRMGEKLGEAIFASSENSTT